MVPVASTFGQTVGEPVARPDGRRAVAAGRRLRQLVADGRG
jgi:hypothetical protein